MTVDDLKGWIAVHRQALTASLLDGSYRLSELNIDISCASSAQVKGRVERRIGW